MADTFIDLKLVDGFVLPYTNGAEQYLGDFSSAWDTLLADYPGLQLDPGFADEQVPLLADMVDAARMADGEPPDPFAWFEVACDDADVPALLDLLFALPFVEFVEPRTPTGLAGRIAYGTNEDTMAAQQLREAPIGIDARFAWRVPGGAGLGVNVADIDKDFNLTHQDLVTLPIDTSIFSAGIQAQKQHGTSCLGIVMAADNGAGMVGIAPDAHANALTERRAGGRDQVDSAIDLASRFVRPGGVIWMPLARFRPWTPGQGEGAIPLELSRKTQAIIQLAGFFGITVIESAGNSGDDLDALAICDHFNPARPTFRDSLAIVVGGAVRQDDGSWKPASTFGARVDCFASFAEVTAPIFDPVLSSGIFGGTSAASSIIAGVVCAIQGMCQAATNGQCLSPVTIRALLRDSSLCTPAGPGGNVGGMPDLRKIADRMGWARILPAPAAVAVAGDSALLATVGAADKPGLRVWSRLFGIGPELPLPASNSFARFDAQPALLMTLETAPLLRTVFEVFYTAIDGALRYFYWDTLGNTGDLDRPRTEALLACGYDVAACHPVNEITTVACILMTGHLVAVDYDATVMGNHDFSEPVALDDLSTYRLTPGPVMLSRKPRTLDVVAIDDGGALRWIAGKIPDDSLTTFWFESLAAQCDVAMAPGVKPGMAGTLDGIAVVAVGVDGALYACGFGLQPLMSDTLAPLPATPAFGPQGQIGLAILNGNTLVAAAVSADGLLYTASRTLAVGSEWTVPVAVDPYTPVSPPGGATVVTQGDTVMIFAVLPNGRTCRADFTPDGGWSGIVPA